MKGLLLKDLSVIRLMVKNFLVIFVIGLVFALGNKDHGMFLAFLGPFCVYNTAVTAFSADEQSSWAAFSLILPVSRKKLVASRYVFLVVCMAFVLLLGGTVSVYNFATAAAQYGWLSLAAFVLSACAYTVGYGALFPLIFKHGYQRMRAVVAGVNLAPVALSLFLYFLFWDSTPNTIVLLCCILAMLAVTALAFLLSFRVSVNIVYKTDY